MDIRDTTKYTQVIQIYLFTGLCLFENLTVQRHRGSFIDQIHCRVDYICPELLGQTSVYPHAMGTLQNSHVHVLYHSVLMRVFENCLYFLDTLTCVELFKSAITIFILIVGLQALKLST